MATVIRDEHHHGTDSGSGVGTMLGIILLVVLAFLLFYYGLPAIRNAGTNVNVPGKIDVNVNNPGGNPGANPGNPNPAQ